MRILRGTAAATLIAVITSTGLAFAHNPGNWGSTDPDTFALYQNVTWRTTYDSVQAYMAVKWSGANYTNISHLIRDHGNRLTLDAHDLDFSLNAWYGSTNLPNPYLDYDDEGPGGTGDWKNEEVEFTSESANAPASGVRYSASFYFSHWYHQGGAYSGWYWDPYDGYISLEETLSKQYAFGDKWNTSICCAEVARLHYPYKAAPAGAIASPDEPVASEPETYSSPARTRKIRISPDVNGNVLEYAANARHQAAAITERGSAAGVLTFSHPVQRDVIERLRATGVEFDTLEATSTPDAQGLRWTMAGIYCEKLWDAFAQTAMENHVHLLGVTSATVRIPTGRVLTSAQRDSDVFLIDLEAEHIRRSTGNPDVVMNDVFWELANWEP